MTNANEARLLHHMLDLLVDKQDIGTRNIEKLRAELPEIPKQKTLEELRKEVYAAWLGAGGNTWDYDGHELETWLDELHTQLKGLIDAEPAKPVHPEFLETEADYEEAPVGTIVAEDNQRPAWKPNEHWFINNNPFDNREMAGGLNPAPSRVLRWGK